MPIAVLAVRLPLRVDTAIRPDATTTMIPM
jgi:hypothetical protein